MCGICGFLKTDITPDKREQTLNRMSALITHRGPDDHGFYHDHPVSLGHRRLSIIDLEGGHQPMTALNGRLVVTFNGEIYNYLELKHELSKNGYRFSTNSDTEVILAGYAREGDKIFEKMNGMFALAIWDRTKGKLVLARDRLGIKPLYYSSVAGGFYFASEIKSIQSVTLQSSLDEEAFQTYLVYGYIQDNRTLVKDIVCLEPGTIMSIDTNNVVQRRRFWQHKYEQVDDLTENEYLEILESKLRIAVKRRMISDVEIGSFLSGGVDSSLIVALMAEMSDRPIKTFSIGFEQTEANEFAYSRLVAKQFSTDHTEILYTQADFMDLLSETLWHQEEPLRHTNCVPLLHLARHAKKKATVILTGEGSDEMFLGYYKYSRARTIASVWNRIPFLSPMWLVRRYLTSLPDREIKKLVPNWSGFSSRDPLINKFLCSTAPTWVEKLADVECRDWLISLLMKQDRMTMASAVESRVPFLDHEVVEFAHSVPIDFKLRNGDGKFLIKNLARRYFSSEFIHREKMGFPVPIGIWMSKGPLRNRMMDVFSQQSFRQRGLFDLTRVVTALDNFPKMKDNKRKEYQKLLLWRIFTFELWAKMFLDRQFEVNDNPPLPWTMKNAAQQSAIQ